MDGSLHRLSRPVRAERRRTATYEVIRTRRFIDKIGRGKAIHDSPLEWDRAHSSCRMKRSKIGQFTEYATDGDH